MQIGTFDEHLRAFNFSPDVKIAQVGQVKLQDDYSILEAMATTSFELYINGGDTVQTLF